MTLPRYKLEQEKLAGGAGFVIGCDEVGRGCLAGPVVAASVVLNPELVSSEWYKEIRDSKLVTPAKREVLAEKIKQECLAYGIGIVAPARIDEINIHQATLLAMKEAVARVTLDTHETGFVLVDGKFPIPGITYSQQAVIGGDATVLSIAAASIVAKVYRDALMVKLHDEFPVYNFARHKGYATAEHRQAIKQNGLSAIHRLSFCGNI